MKKQSGVTVLELLVAILLLAGTVGWVMNIVEIVHTVAGPITGLFIVRCVGIFVAPLGAVMGFV